MTADDPKRVRLRRIVRILHRDFVLERLEGGDNYAVWQSPRDDGDQVTVTVYSPHRAECELHRTVALPIKEFETHVLGYSVLGKGPDLNAAVCDVGRQLRALQDWASFEQSLGGVAR